MSGIVTSHVYVIALWDIENSPIPDNKLDGLWANIQKSLKKCNKDFILQDVIAIGPRSKKPTNLHAYMAFEELSVITIPCEANPQDPYCY